MIKNIKEKIFDFSKVQNFLAFLFYTTFIIGFYFSEKLPLAITIIFQLFIAIVTFLAITKFTDNIGSFLDTFNLERLNKILLEILKFIPIFVLDTFITSFLMKGIPANQASVNNMHASAPLFHMVMSVIIAPICEEFIFRYLPYKFIKNKKLYVILSAVIFAGMHVIYDPNPFYYIWFYMLFSIYCSYRYYKTKDILVTISMHSFNNLICVLSMIILS